MMFTVLIEALLPAAMGAGNLNSLASIDQYEAMGPSDSGHLI